VWTSPGVTLAGSSTSQGYLESTGSIQSAGAGGGSNLSFLRVANTFTGASTTSSDAIGVINLTPTVTLSAQTPQVYGIKYNPTITGTPSVNYGVIVASTAGNSGFGTLTPTSTLQSAGSFATGYVAKTGAYTLTVSDHTVEVTSGTHTQTLPTAVGIAGREYIITNSGAGVVTVETTSSQTFVNVSATPTTLTLNQFETARVKSNGANWLRL